MQKKNYSKLFGVVLTVLMLMQLTTPCFAILSGDTGEEVPGQGMVVFDENGFLINSYVDMGEGWVAALERAESGKQTRNKLLSDWTPNTEDGFYYEDDDDDEYGTNNGCLYLEDEDVDIAIDLNGHSIDRKLTSATDDGHVFWVYGSTLTIYDSSEAQTGKITGAYSDEEGGAFYIRDEDSKVYIKGGTICGNKAEEGGAFFVYNGSLYIEGGTITDNMAVNGGGIYWESRNKFILTGGQITGNKATEHGGGAYLTDYGDVYLGGTIAIKNNTSTFGTENIYLFDENVTLNHTAGQDDSIPLELFRYGAYVGVTCGNFNGERIVANDDSGFFDDATRYIISDDARVGVIATQNSSKTGYSLTFSSRNDGVMYVAQEGAAPEVFDNFSTGWEAAVLKSKTKPTTVTLGADWIAPNGSFYTIDNEATDNGRLYLNDSDIRLTVDLNGHTISRNLDNPVEHGQVFRIESGSLTIVDTSSSQTGKITGANNDGNGGAFYIDNGSLYINGGTITGNTCTENGAGVYWHSSGVLAMTGGKITSNTSGGHGGGVYVGDNGIHVGGTAVISGNTGFGATENVYLVDSDKYISHTAGQNSLPYAPLSAGAVIGVSCNAISTSEYITNEGGKNYFDTNSLQYFVSDVPGYSIECKEVSGECHLYVFAKYDGNMIVTADGTEGTFTDFAEGWVYALKKSREKPTKIILDANWIAPGGNFYCTDAGSEYGTDNGRLYINDSDINLTIDLNGYTISRNLAIPTENGQVFRVTSGSLTIMDSSEEGTGTITGGNNKGNGGGFYMDNGTLYIKGGNITGNKCTGNGAGVYWYSSGDFAMTGGIITENEADGIGGGVFVDYKGIHVGGTAIITDNTAKGKPNNVYLNSSERYISNAVGQTTAIPNEPLREGAKIGVTCAEIKHYEDFGKTDSGFLAENVQYFESDDKTYFVDTQIDSNGKVRFSLAYDQDGCVYVTAEGEETKEFYDLGKGWVYAVEKSKTKPTTIKLGVDLISFGTDFYYVNESAVETYTDEGRLYLNDSNINLTIDLNGYEIRRNLPEAVEDGQIFHIKDGSLTITDTSEDQNGKITGGNNTDNGGGFYIVGGNLCLKGGSICGNKAIEYGGGIYITEAKLVLDGGSISNNSAERGGGGILVHEDGEVTIENGDISNNFANWGGGGVRGESNAVVYMKGGSVADNKSDGHGGGFYFYDGNASMYLTGGSILRNKSSAGGGIYWESLGTLVMTGGVITENHTTTYEYGKTWNSNMGGGVHVHHFDEFITEIGSDPYIGGTIQIYGNTSCTPPMYNEVVVESNLYLSGNDVMLNHAMGQKSDVPNMPLTDGANVGISMEDAELIADDYSKFNESSLKYLHADCDNFYIQSVLDDDYYEVSLVFQSAILAFDKTGKKATVYITKPGKYTLIFADYENDALKNVDFVEYDFEEGINYVSQSNFNIYLGISDKIMLWHDTKNLIPVCKAYIVE